MDSQRNIYFVLFILSLFMLFTQWQQFQFKKNNPNIPTQTTVETSSAVNSQNLNNTIGASSDGVGVPRIGNLGDNTSNLPNPINPTNLTNPINSATPNNPNSIANNIEVLTDNFKVRIAKQGGNIVYAELVKHRASEGDGNIVIMDVNGVYQYSARSGLVTNNNNIKLPSHFTNFEFEKTNYDFTQEQAGESWQVRSQPIIDAGIEVVKVFTFYKNQYTIEVGYEIINNSDKPLDYSAYYLLNRNNELPKIGFFGLHTYTGPAYYTTERKFNKVDFADITKNPDKFRFKDNNGYVALIQHYFVSAWVLKPQQLREFFFQPEVGGRLFSAGLAFNSPTINVGSKDTISAKVYIGPQDQDHLNDVTDGLSLVVDYGIFTIFAEPLFWVMKHIYKLVGNWGWTIVLLTILIKALFFPLSAASFKSMAKMRKLAPKIQRLREVYPEDKQKQQQEMLKLYKTEKINPLGGCLPILIQIPVFIALYWVLLSSVEMRNSPWIGWITNLANPDPYFILPILYAVSMYITTKLNPLPPDPMQQKILMAMPIVFSVMFFFFPSGLVLYWVVNNIITIGQQYYNNKMYGEK